MIKKIIQRLKFYRQICFFRYVYLNHFCKSVIRTDQSRIIPYKGAVIDLAAGAKLYVGGGDLEIGCDRLCGSHAETRVRLRENAVWSSEGGCRLSYETTVEVLSGGFLDSQFFTMNTGSVLIAAKAIALGRDVMIGRNAVIYDSDHHTICNDRQETTNPDAKVTIGDHVWLATNAMVLKGTTIGEGSMIAANAVVHGTVPPDSQYMVKTMPVIRANYGAWKRTHPEEG